MSSLGDALERESVERRARLALRGKVGALLGEYAELMQQLPASLLVPVHTWAGGWFGEPPIAVHAYVVPWLRALPYAVHESWGVTADGTWSPLRRRLLDRQAGLADRYWGWAPDEGDVHDLGWEPGGVSLSASYADDVASGRLYPQIAAAALGDPGTIRKKRGTRRPPEYVPFAEMLATHYRWHQQHLDEPLPTTFTR